MIFLGMINGGLGFKYAGYGVTKRDIALYSVGVGLSLLIWVAVAVWDKTRSQKPRRGSGAEALTHGSELQPTSSSGSSDASHEHVREKRRSHDEREERRSRRTQRQARHGGV